MLLKLLLQVIVSALALTSVAAVYQEPARIAYAAPIARAYAPAPVAAYAAAPAVAKVAVDTDYDPHPQYSYAYDIQDALTGDSKSQHETRDGDVVQGVYSLIEPDGTRRTVEYTADPHNGFNAVVHREPGVQKAIVAAAPALARVAATPIAYAAAPAHVAYAAPAPVAYAAPTVARLAAPVATYAAAPRPLAYAAAPALAVSRPVAAAYAPAYRSYAAPAIHTSFSAPFVSYAY